MDGHRSARAGYRIPLTGRLTVTLRLTCGYVVQWVVNPTRIPQSVQELALNQRDDAASMT